LRREGRANPRKKKSIPVQGNWGYLDNLRLVWAEKEKKAGPKQVVKVQRGGM